jgi:hypothetical protein
MHAVYPSLVRPRAASGGAGASSTLLSSAPGAIALAPP